MVVGSNEHWGTASTVRGESSGCEAERREVALLIADLVGPGTMAEEIEPAALSRVISAHMSAVTAAASAWGGTVEGRAGARVSIIFATPLVPARAAPAAVAAALEIQGHARALSAGQRQQGLPAGLQTRIVVSSGTCVVGTFECETARVYMAVGGAAETAISLQARATPDTIVCDRATWLQVKSSAVGRPIEPAISDLGVDWIERYEILGLIGRQQWPAPQSNIRDVSSVRPSLRRDGEYWTMVHGRVALHFKDSKGLRCLGRLLADPGSEIHVVELMASIGTGGPPAVGARSGPLRGAALNDGPGGPVLDQRAKAEYRLRLQDVEHTIDEAVAFGDTERASRAASEKDALLQQLAAALGLGGRDRQISSSISERARINVTRTIRAAIEKIGASSPEIGRHLRATIRTGLFCCYDPAPGAPGPWLVG